MKETKIALKISQIIINLSVKTDISPRGLISLLMLIFQLISVNICNEFAQSNFFQALINLLKDQQI
jgi:hypothetical protein